MTPFLDNGAIRNVKQNPLNLLRASVLMDAVPLGLNDRQEQSSISIRKLSP